MDDTPKGSAKEPNQSTLTRFLKPLRSPQAAAARAAEAPSTISPSPMKTTHTTSPASVELASRKRPRTAQEVRKQ
jgi:hypothetical protein